MVRAPRGLALPLVLTLLLGASLIQPSVRTIGTPDTKLVAASAGWPTYHRDNTRAGYDPATPAYPPGGPPSARWSSGTLDGAVYAETLALAGRIYVASENNSLYALDEGTGSLIWYHHYAASVGSGTGGVTPGPGRCERPLSSEHLCVD